MKQMSNEQRIETERRVVRKLIRIMKEHGWAATSVYDGEEREKTRTENEVLEAVYSVDESWITFEKDGKKHRVYIILGNSPWEPIADWGFSEGDPDGFNAVMDGPVMQYVHKVEDECS